MKKISSISALAKVCRDCKRSESDDLQFEPRANWCVDCKNVYYREKARKRYTPETGRNKNLKQNYGITHEECEAMFLSQGGVCAVCSLAETAINPYTKQVQNLHVDHCHKTGRVRALLCQDCNIAYGQLKEDPERIRKLLRYAESQGENL